MTDPNAVFALLGNLDDRRRSTMNMLNRIVDGEPSDRSVLAEVLLNHTAIMRGQQIIISLLTDQGLATRSMARDALPDYQKGHADQS